MTNTSIVVLTGAGISAESGIQTFRAADGLWENHRVEDVASPEGFARDPALVHRFYNDRRAQLLSPGIKPNAGHQALSRLEAKHDGDFLLITQNIDNLHERAGNRNLLHMHGESLKIRCQHSGKIFDCDYALSTEQSCECCQIKGNLRPHIVWFGEMPLYMEEIEQALMGCDVFLSIGTSGNVYPAAGFVQLANHAGAKTVEINLEPSNTHTEFDEKLYGEAGQVLPAYVEQLLSSSN